MATQLVPLRACIISQVLGTDMKKHFDIVSRFQVHLSQIQAVTAKHAPDAQVLELVHEALEVLYLSGLGL